MDDTPLTVLEAWQRLGKLIDEGKWHYHITVHEEYTLDTNEWDVSKPLETVCIGGFVK